MRDEKSLFEANTIYKFKNGIHHYDCKKGLWGTSSTDKKRAKEEATHYFWQYHKDGEYS
ncbi:hypothetical protein KI655_18420 [Vibrio sp. D404a]|uniref:hypothetical protein n=1 Tax=unclassified Vibrio TaxID=2614977 RepID=UPI002555D43E|nr:MULTISPECIES: hypothetical protein [unclassified Vibrio]MDK9739273.1 hypothetical protein [Vibrio sp. D404a]MDK9797691.1 hypothetical protein [Vibrio sp. D449a]